MMPGGTLAFINAIFDPAKAILEAKYKRQQVDKTNKNTLREGTDSNTAIRPEATAKKTKFVPRNKPKTQRNDFLKPYAAPNPAVLNTPGPGVIINKNTEIAKVSIQSNSRMLKFGLFQFQVDDRNLNKPTQHKKYKAGITTRGAQQLQE